MFTSMRSALKNNTYKIIMWCIVLSLALGSLPPLLRKQGSGGSWIFRINNQEVAHSELTREIERQQSYFDLLRAQFGQYADMIMKNMTGDKLVAQAVQTVQQEELMNQVADSLGVYISNDYAIDALHQRSFVFNELIGLVPYGALSDAGIDQKMLYHYLAKKGISMSDFERKVERLLAQKLVGEVVSVASYIPNFELKNIFSTRFLDKKFSYFKLTIDDYLKKEKQKEIGRDSLISFYNDHRANYVVSEKRNGIKWTFDKDAYGITIADAEIENYYNKHKSEAEFQDKPSQAQVRTILFTPNSEHPNDEAVLQFAKTIRKELISNPTAFEAKAKALSADKETKDKGGLLPPIIKGEKNNPAFERAVFVLASPGDISEVVKTDRGYELIQLVEKKLRTVKPLSAVKNDIKKRLETSFFKNRFEAQARSITASQEGLEAIEEFAKQKNAKKELLTTVVLDGSRDLQVLFDIKSLHRAGSFYENNKGFIVYLTEIHKSYTPSFEVVEDQVKNDFYRYNAQKKLEADLKQAQTLLATSSLSELPKRFGGSFATSEWIKPNDTEKLSSFLPKNTPQESLFQMEKKGAARTVIVDDGGVLILLHDVQSFDKDAFVEKKAAIRAENEGKNEQAIQDGFVASLFKNAIIETREEKFN